MEINGGKVRIAALTLEDAYYMVNWGIHKNPLLSDYNLNSFNKYDIKQWFEYKTGSKNQKYYCVFNENNRAVGYMGIKKIRWIFRDSVLGIAFDPNYTNQGYGTDAIMTFLDYYFNNMRMKKMFLEVAQFNKIAIRCYEKNGFRIINRYLAEFFNQKIDLNDPYFKKEESSFRIKNGKIYAYIYKMKIDTDSYFRAREDINEPRTDNKTRSIID